MDRQKRGKVGSYKVCEVKESGVIWFLKIQCTAFSFGHPLGRQKGTRGSRHYFGFPGNLFCRTTLAYITAAFLMGFKECCVFALQWMETAFTASVSEHVNHNKGFQMAVGRCIYLVYDHILIRKSCVLFVMHNSCHGSASLLLSIIIREMKTLDRFLVILVEEDPGEVCFLNLLSTCKGWGWAHPTTAWEDISWLQLWKTC